MVFHRVLLGCWLAAALLVGPAGPAAGQELATTVARMDSSDDAVFTAGTPRVVAGPNGRKALRFDRESFSCRIDLAAQGVKPGACDLIKIQVRADRGAVMKVALQGHPDGGDTSYWWALDSMRAGFDWQTIWIDLGVPEEIKEFGGTKRRWREGMADRDAGPALLIDGSIKDLKSAGQGSHRRFWLGEVRFAREAVHVDWNQSKAPYTWGDGKDLVFTYPIQVTNRLDTPITARLELKPVEVEHARASLEQKSVKLGARQTTTVAAEIMLPAAVAKAKEALYCERFALHARAEGIPDSTVTILRSSDPIHLTVTVPIDESKLTFPYFTPPSELPHSLMRWDRKLAEANASRDPQPLIQTALRHGLFEYGRDTKGVAQFRKTLVAAAYLHDMTGKHQYLRTATTLVEALPRIWAKWYAAYRHRPVRVISNGIVARWGEKHHYTLGLGWLVMGTQRGPYYYGRSGNGAGGSMSSIAYAFDIIADQLDPAVRQQVIDGFFLPAAIQARNHYVGDGNQQATADLTAMWGGLLARNWPLVSFGYSSEHGYRGILQWEFDDDGVQLRKNYQTYTMRPLLWTNEMLYGAGVDLYQRHRQRLTQIVHADTRAKGQGAPYQDTEFWDFVERTRMK